MKIRERWQRFKAWTKKQARRLKVWALGILVAIGVVAVPPAFSGSKDFSWTNPTQHTDGTPYDAATMQRETRLYCTSSGSALPVIVVPGAATNYSATLNPGDYECNATVVSTAGVESFASNTVAFTVDNPIPNAPVLED